MNIVEKEIEIRKRWPNAKCGEQYGRWYVETEDGSSDSLIAVHYTEEEVVECAYQFALRFPCV